MRRVWATQYEPGQFPPVAEWRRRDWVRECMDKVRGGQWGFYQREDDTLVIAQRLPDRIHWFDTIMRAWGGEMLLN